MLIGERLRKLREEKKLSQSDIEKRTGLLRANISRMEQGHSTPTIQTLEKLARALEVPLLRLFYECSKPPNLPQVLARKSQDHTAWDSSGEDEKFLRTLRRLLSKINEQERRLILHMARKMARRSP
jgi:transcriptional regulator with XRE-family HTH domain